MKKILLFLCGFALTSAETASAQNPASPSPAGESPAITVYVPDFQQSESIPEIGDLGAFASSLIRLELLASPVIDIRHDSPPQACPSQLRVQAPREEQRSGNAAPVPTSPRNQSVPASYYVVCGKLEVRQPESEIVVDYYVEKWDRANRTLLFQETQPFLPEHALDQLRIASHTVAFRIWRAVPRTRVAVAAFKPDGESEEQKQIADEVTRAVTDRLAESQDLTLSDQAPYQISGRLFFLKEGLLSHISTKWSAVRAEINVRARGEDHPLDPILVARESLAELNTKASEETVARLNEIRLAERPGWKEFLAPREAHEWAERAKQLLCMTSGPSCKQDVPAAITILLTASARYPDDFILSFLLGYAQLSAGNYTEALNALRNAKLLFQKAQASATAVPPEEGTKILNTLGDAYRSIGDYSTSVAEYDESLKSNPAQPDIIVRKAEAMRFDGKREAALRTLIDGLRAGSDSVAIHQAAQSMIRGLYSQDLDASLQLLKQAFASNVKVRDEYALALLLKGESLATSNASRSVLKSAREPLEQVLELEPSDTGILIETNCSLANTYLDGQDVDRGEVYIQKAEELAKNAPPSPEVMAWILRLQVIYLLHKEDYNRASETAQSALRVYPQAAEKYVFAQSAYFWARHLEAEPPAATSGNNTTPSPEHLYREVLEVTEPLVDTRYASADWLFREASHSLNRNAQARSKFQAILKENPNDISALEELMYICNEFLFDTRCALSAAEQHLGAQGGTDDLGLLLDSIEVAVLSGSYTQASKWLGMAEKMAPMPPNRELIVRLYQTWIAVAHGDEALLHQALDRWTQALREYRASDIDLDWSFIGATHTLQSGSFKDQERKLLGDMIASAQDKSRNPPTSVPR